MSEEHKFAYVARDPRCGCVVAATMDDPRHASETAKEVAKWIRRGDHVERVDMEQVMVTFGGCPVCCPEFYKKPAKQDALL
jgi:hypothetical protein